MNAFAKTEKGYNKQLAAAYILYMMGGSFFRECKCRTPYEEKHLHLHYAEMPQAKQLDLENRVLTELEHMDRKFLNAVGELKSEAFCIQRNGQCVVEFRTGGFEEMQCVVEKNGDFRILPVHYF